MAGLHDFTTKEVLNKVLLDSSGNAVAAYSHTTQEALNAVLDSANSRLNVKIEGGTISGDVTIAGDLTVNGGGSYSYSEVLAGDMKITTSSSATALYIESSDSGASLIQFTNSTTGTTANDGLKVGLGDDEVGLFRMQEAKDMVFQTDSTTRMTITSDGVTTITSSSTNGSGTVTGLHLKNTGTTVNDGTKLLFTSGTSTAGASIYNQGKAGDSSDLVFEAGGSTERMRISSTGHTQITAADGSGLALKSASSSNPKLTFLDSGGGTKFAIQASTSGATFSGGDVKITSATDAKPILTLEQTGDNSNAGQLIFLTSGAANDNDDSGVIRFKGMNDAGTPEEIEYATIYVNHDDVSDGSEDATMHFRTQSGGSLGSRMVIKSENIGINTDSPTEKLHVEGKVFIRRTGTATAHADTDLFVADSTAVGSYGQIQILGGTEGASNLYFSDTASYSVGGIKYAHNSNHMYFRLNDADKMTLNNTGLGIGTSSPNGKVAIHSGSAGGSSAIYNRADELVIENSDHAGITIKSPTDKETSVFFGDADDSSRGGIRYNHDGDTMTFQVASAKLILDTTSRISLSNNDSNSNNTVFGKDAFNDSSNDASDKNVAIGELAMGTGSIGGATRNVAIGYSAFTDATSGTNNVAIGHNSALNLTGGNDNIVIGREAMQTSTSAENCVVIGTNAMQSANHSSNDGSVAIGKLALSDKNLASGAQFVGATTAIGYKALTALTSGAGNTAIGHNALLVNQTGASNTVIGYETAKNTTGSQNVVVGSDSGKGIGSAGNNTYVGYAVATNASSSGNSNTFIGSAVASGGAYTGSSSVGIGRNALLSGTNGERNVAIGMAALGANADDDNVAVGFQALYQCTGTDNVALGNSTGDTVTSGSNNTLLGRNAQLSANTGSGQIPIGKGVSCVADNTVTIGIDANTASLGLDGSDTSWAAASSDERLKENIESSSAGLDVINDLRPVTYNWKKAKDVQEDLPQYKDSDKPVLGTEYGERLHGFIAQEVKEVIDNHDELEDGFKMWKLKDDGTQTVADGNLVPILVKAVQELSARVKELESK